jgi:hypothetical protein
MEPGPRSPDDTDESVGGFDGPATIPAPPPEAVITVSIPPAPRSAPHWEHFASEALDEPEGARP